METNLGALIIESASKKSLVPSAGYYESTFEARAGLGRLLSSPIKTRTDITGVLDAIARSKSAHADQEVGSRLYQAIGFLDTPRNDEIEVISEVLNSVQYPGNDMAKKLAFSDGSGTMAAIVMMSGKTSPDATAQIASTWKLQSGIMAPDIKRRTSIISKIIEASQDGAIWTNLYLQAIIANIGMMEGWHTPSVMNVLMGVTGIPEDLFEVILKEAPDGVTDIVVKKEATSTTNYANIINIVGITKDDSVSVESLREFLRNPSVPNKEKILLYEFFIHNGGEGGKFADRPIIKTTVLKEFSLIKSQETFDVALSHIVDGSDTESIKEMTSNLDFSLLDYRTIMNVLEQKNALNQTDPEFLAYIRAIDDNLHATDEQMEDLMGDGLLSFASINQEYANCLSKEGASVRDAYVAILSAAILISMGYSMSMALSSTKTTARDLAANPEIIKRARIIVQKAPSSPELDQKVKQIVENAKKTPIHQNQPQPKKKHPRPTPAQSKTACEINRQLVDSIIMMEHVPGKDYSSKGAVGLMQIMPNTWDEINRKHFQGKYSFHEHGKNNWINRRFGTIHLQEIKDYLDSHRGQWKTDQLPLIFACYFGGIGNIRKAGFDPRKIKAYYPLTYDYMVRGSNLMGYDTKKL